MFYLKTLILFALPLILIRLDNKDVKIIKVLSVIVWCYLIGFLLNLSGLGFDKKLAETVASISFPLSLPLLLFEVNFLAWLKLAKPTVKGFMVAIFSSISTSLILGAIVFKDIPEIDKYAAMMSGMMTGGNVNFTALSVAFGVDANSYIGLYTSEAVIGALYLFLIFKFASPFLKKYFLQYENLDLMTPKDHQVQKMHTGNSIIALSASILIVAISAAASMMLFKKLELTFLVFTITTLALVIGLNTKLHKIKESYIIGEYLLYVFCLSLGLLLDISKLSKIGLSLFLFVTASYLIVIIVHFLICKWMKIDGHTALITNVAGIFGPPFILPVAKVLKNDAIVVSGLTTSLVGQAIGTYIGFFVLWLIRLL